MSSAPLRPLAPADHIPNRIRSAIASGARATGTDFTFLLAQARLESGLNPTAKAPTSSASGLFQFIEGTWLATLARHGGAHGYAEVAARIENSGGRYFVRDPAVRAQIMQLRHDPTTASVMAGALAQDNRAALLPVLGRAPDGAEMYLAHFLGAGGAATFLRALNANPDAPAAALLPQAAKANRAIFYDGGTPRSLTEVMDLLRGKLEQAMKDGGGAGAAGLVANPGPFGGSAWVEVFNRRPLLPAPAPDRRATPTMSRLLEASFAPSTSSLSGEAVPAHVRAAYTKLRTFAL